MRILYVSMDPIENNTSANIRNRGLIKGLLLLGYEVSTLTLKPDVNCNCYENLGADIRKQIKNSYYIEPLKMFSKLRTKKTSNSSISNNNKVNKISFKSMLSYIARYMQKKLMIYDLQRFNIFNVSKKIINVNDYDYIVSSSDPKSSHLIVNKFIGSNNAKWIQYWGDPMLNDCMIKPSWLKRKRLYLQEKKLLSRAGKVVYVSPFTLKYQQDKYKKFAEKMIYVNQACIEKKEKIVHSELINKNIYNISYTGSYCRDVRNIYPLFESVKESTNKLMIVGDTDIELPSCQNISVQGRVSLKTAEKIENESDIIVCLLNRKGTQIPGKVYYVAKKSKPVILILDGVYTKELDKYFKKFNRYIVCHNTKESINQAINMAIEELNKIDKYELQDEYTYEYLAKKIINPKEEICND